MADDLWWETTFDLRRHLVEDNLRWRTAFSGIRPLVTTLGGRQPWEEDDIRWKTTFGGRQLSEEDNL